MKHIYLLVISLFILFNLKAQTAVDFQVSDCNGDPYHFFEQLDAGKVVVIGWAMPCGSCVLPLKTTYNVVQSYEADFPGRVQMIIADDYANTPCSSIDLWKDSNGMTNTLSFSDPAIKMTNYGSVGMPKVVVVAGDDRLVYYNANDAVDHEALKEAIDQAISVILSRQEVPEFVSDLVIAPNPARTETLVRLSLTKSVKASWQLTDQLGKTVLQKESVVLSAGAQRIQLDLANLQPGIYQLQLMLDQDVYRHKLLITK